MPNAVITGGTRGIGKAIAEKLLSEGFSIAICSRTEQELNELKTLWTKVYPDVIVFTKVVDLAITSQIRAFGHDAQAALGTIDILANNAGIYVPLKLMDEPEGHLEKTMQVNMYSAYHLTQTIVPKMQAKSSGHIFNICSVASLKAYPGVGSYGISKYALLGFTENLREELKEDGIKVTALCPGGTLTSSWDGVEIAPERLIAAKDVAEILWTTYKLSEGANVESIVIRPSKGDL